MLGSKFPLVPCGKGWLSTKWLELQGKPIKGWMTIPNIRSRKDPGGKKSPTQELKKDTKSCWEDSMTENEASNLLKVGWMWPHPVTVTTRIITFLVGDSYKPSFATVTGRGPHPI